MPSYRKQYAKKPRKKTYAQYKAKKNMRAKQKGYMPRARAAVPGAFQILNKYKAKSHYFEDSFTSSSTTGSGIQFQSIVKFNMSLIGRYSTLKSMYNQYRVKWLKIRIQMLQIENSDGSVIPEIYLRYCYNPQLTAASLSIATMLSQQNVIYKRLLQGDGAGSDFEYTIKPAILTAQQIYNSSNFTSAPRFNQWCDFQTLGADEVDHYGMALYIPNVPTGVTLTYKYTVGYECRDII